MTKALTSVTGRLLTTSPCEDLTNRYEDLRYNVVTGDASDFKACGFSVFVRHGMAAWMKAWSEFVPAQPRYSPESMSSQSIVPEAIQQEVVHVLAAMALGAQQ